MPRLLCLLLLLTLTLAVNAQHRGAHCPADCNLEHEHCSVCELAPNPDNSGDGPTSKEREYSTRYTRNLQQELDQLYGPDRVRVQVQVELTETGQRWGERGPKCHGAHCRQPCMLKHIHCSCPGPVDRVTVRVHILDLQEPLRAELEATAAQTLDLRPDTGDTVIFLNQVPQDGERSQGLPSAALATSALVGLFLMEALRKRLSVGRLKRPPSSTPLQG